MPNLVHEPIAIEAERNQYFPCEHRFVQANPFAPKHVFSAMQESARHLVPNISRAVLEEVRESEPVVPRIGWTRTIWMFEPAPETSSENWPAVPEAARLHVLLQRIAVELQRKPTTTTMVELLTDLEGFLSVLPANQKKNESFVHRARRLASRGQIDSALDLIYDQIDELLLSSDFDRVDRTLSEASPDDLPLPILLAILTATLPAKGRLQARSAFFESVQRSLKERGEFEDELLVGLE